MYYFQNQGDYKTQQIWCLISWVSNSLFENIKKRNSHFLEWRDTEVELLRVNSLIDFITFILICKDTHSNKILAKENRFMFYFFIGQTLFIACAFFQFNLVVVDSCKTNAVLLPARVSY